MSKILKLQQEIMLQLAQTKIPDGFRMYSYGADAPELGRNGETILRFNIAIEEMPVNEQPK